MRWEAEERGARGHGGQRDTRCEDDSEKCHGKFDAATALSYARAYGVNAGWLLTGEGKQHGDGAGGEVVRGARDGAVRRDDVVAVG